MNLCYHEDVSYSEKNKWLNYKQYPFKYNHGTCKENKVGTGFRCKDNESGSTLSPNCFGKEDYNDKRRHTNFYTKQPGIEM